MNIADRALDAACNWAANRPWVICTIICASILFVGWVDGSGR